MFKLQRASCMLHGNTVYWKFHNIWLYEEFENMVMLSSTISFTLPVLNVLQ
jgi:hypothetical protein